MRYMGSSSGSVYSSLTRFVRFECRGGPLIKIPLRYHTWLRVMGTVFVVIRQILAVSQTPAAFIWSTLSLPWYTSAECVNSCIQLSDSTLVWTSEQYEHGVLNTSNIYPCVNWGQFYCLVEQEQQLVEIIKFDLDELIKEWFFVLNRG